eukprot:scaffold12460_cov128-Skeletonema_marinoi.AAC.10
MAEKDFMGARANETMLEKTDSIISCVSLVVYCILGNDPQRPTKYSRATTEREREEVVIVHEHTNLSRHFHLSSWRASILISMNTRPIRSPIEADWTRAE